MNLGSAGVYIADAFVNTLIRALSSCSQGHMSKTHAPVQVETGVKKPANASDVSDAHALHPF